MVLFLRSCILNQKKLFIQEVSFNRMVVFNVFNNGVKKFTNVQQMKHFSSNNDTDEDRTLIYRGLLRKRVRNLKLLSLTTSGISLAFQPLFLEKLGEMDSSANIAVLCIALSFVCISTPIFVHLCSKRYVNELYHCPKEDKYIAKVYNFFVREKEIEFTPKDVTPPGDSTIFTTCMAKQFPLLFDENYFLEPKHYFIIMGYNKPIDFEVEKLNIQPLNQPPIIDCSRQIDSGSKAIK